jgi:hypothetical protein
MDKRIGELEAVKVGNATLTSGTDYTIIDSTGTTIALTNAYLESLSAGIKNLTVEFYGGVKVADTFTITNPSCTNGATNYPACNNNQTPPTVPTSS